MNLLIVFGCQIQNANNQDSILDILKSKISKEWDFKLENDTLVIKSNDSLWIGFYNIAGAPFDDPEYKKFTDEYLQKHGRKIKACIIFRAEEKWTIEKISEIKNENLKIQEEIENLISKYQLSHLERTFRWEEELFWNTTTEEEIRIEAYKKEKAELEAKKKELPDYSSQNYSLFIISRNWEESLSYMVPMICPEKEKIKINELEMLLNELLANK
ncbi:MAG: hypothetical protein V1904_15705 [Bacteroidota bacterium]